MFKTIFIIVYYFIKITKSSSYDYDYYNNNDFEGYVENLGSNWNELDKINEMKFEDSINKCANSIVYNNNTHIKKNLKHYCFTSGNLDLVEETLIYGSGKLFSYDQNIVGLITNGDFSVRFYNFNPILKSLTRIYMKSFHERVPFDACVDKAKNIFIVFPDEQMITKYVLETSINNGVKSIRLREIAMKVEREYNPSSITCYDDHIYISERPTNTIRVHDSNLNLVKKIEISGVVISMHRAIDVNQVARIFADDSSGVAFFNQIENTGDNSANACHFYHQKNCIEDVTLKLENKNKTLIYIADGCSNEVKQFEYNNNRHLYYINSYNTNGKPVSILANDHGYVFVLTKIDKISRINVYYPRMCDSNYIIKKHKKMLI
jgi:hypothetical protein